MQQQWPMSTERPPHHGDPTAQDRGQSLASDSSTQTQAAALVNVPRNSQLGGLPWL